MRVFLDANVLASKTLRDWILKLSLEAPFLLALFSSAEVLVETRRVFMRRNPEVAPEVVARLIELISSVLSDVVYVKKPLTGVEAVNPGDVHVHWGAIRAEATHLVTSNLRDFPGAGVAPYLAISPDAFLMTILETSPASVEIVARDERSYWSAQADPALRVKSLGQALRDAGCPAFAEEVERLIG